MFGLGKKKKAADAPVPEARAPKAELSEEDFQRFPQMSDIAEEQANNVPNDVLVGAEPEPIAPPQANNDDDDLPPPPFMAQMPPQAQVQQYQYPPQRSPPAEDYVPPAPPVKGPVFVSLEKYREVKQMLHDLKAASADLRQIISDLKQNRDQGTDLLKQSVERLSSIDARVDDITATLRAG